MYVSNQSPYYDDFDETKQFQRILFRPGRAIQARELTQLQSILQKQLDRVGSHFFKEGSIVIPGEIVFEKNYNFVKLQNTYNSIDADNVIEEFVGFKVYGATTGLIALVVNSTLSEGTDPPTLYVKYLNSGTNGTTYSFLANEILTLLDANDSLSTTSVRTATSSPTGTGTAFNISSGVIFTKGVFAYFPTSTLIVSKYSRTTTDKKIGFLITEEILDDQDDATLLDPAVGTANYFAPGADRYKIGLTLEARGITFNTSIDDTNFIELLRIENNQVTFTKPQVEYNLLADNLARRTFDESGNYTVKPYRIELFNHLKTSNAIRDGYLTAADGGSDDLYVAALSPGKSYVKGYEIQNLLNNYVIGTKARANVAINGGTIATNFGNYIYITDVHSIPDLTSLVTLELYNKYTTAKGLRPTSSTLVGNAKVRALEYFANTIGTSTAVYKLYLFDVSMVGGYIFEEDVKQVFYDNNTFTNFTANIVPTQKFLSGTVSTTNASNVITGSGTSFDTELETGDWIVVGNKSYNIASISNAISLKAVTNADVTVTGFPPTLSEVNIVNNNRQAYLFKLPYSTIKTVDPNNQDTDYTVRRIYDRTLAGGVVTITSGTNETFTSYDTDKYQLVVKADGTYQDLSGKVTRGGTPTGRTVTFDLSANASLASADVRIITTLRKQDSAAVRKIKTLNQNSTVDYTSNTTATSSSISLQKADIFKVNSVRMSQTNFGTSYSESNSLDITDRYNVDNGQRLAFYDVGRINLKPGYPKPIGPIRINFDYFSHSSGDYFSVDSYVDIDYKSIPSVVLNGVTYNLRDSIDFRPRISDSGINFSATGSSATEFLDPDIDFQADYEYYIPKTDKLVIDSRGNISIISGISSTVPVEPRTPDDTMALYVLKQNAYVFNVDTDINITQIDNRRYTMRDIGRIETRVKNLEYYTTLNLLENETATLQVQDINGFDRFKNGFVVDNFTGHGIGDVSNPDYNISMDLNKRELRPVYSQDFFKLFEFTSAAGRSSNNYTKVGTIILPTYTEEIFLASNNATKQEFLNPFNVLDFRGILTLTPASDTWFDTAKLPVLAENNNGTYDTLTPISEIRATYETIYGSWRDFWYGNERSETKVTDSTSNKSSIIRTSDVKTQSTGTRYEIIETIDNSGDQNIVTSRVVVPKMRNVDITFSVKGMKANTRLYAFFDDIDVSSYTTLTAIRANAIVNSGSYNVSNAMVYLDLITDLTGSLEGVFRYSANDLNLNSGSKVFRLTDSPTNSDDRTSVADATFNSSGELTFATNIITKPIPAPVIIPPVANQNNYLDTGTDASRVDTDTTPQLSYVNVALNSIGSSDTKAQQVYAEILTKRGVTDQDVASLSDASLDTVSGSISSADYFSGGSFRWDNFAGDVISNDFANISESVKDVYQATEVAASNYLTQNTGSIIDQLVAFEKGGADAARDKGMPEILVSLVQNINNNPNGDLAKLLDGASLERTISIVAAAVSGAVVLGTINDGTSINRIGP